MSLISNRPAYWNEVVGQQRVQRVLSGVLKHPQYMTRGFIFSGVTGLGKTTLAYLFAKLVMCHSADPFLCTTCPSCQSFVYDQYGNLNHPDFTEVDAASHSGVDAARAILTNSDQNPMFDKRRVILIDEAHRLSTAAWDVYLKPLEISSTGAIFIFSTNDAKEIPKTIQSRCTFLEFSMVTREDLIGLLMSIVDRERIPYVYAGLVHIAEMAKGRPRFAVNMLQTVAVTGTISPENCALVLSGSLDDAATKILELLVQSSKTGANAEDLIAEALKIADNAGQLSGPYPLVDALFRIYARAFFENSEIAHTFTQFKAITAIFLKWTRTQQIPVDALPLLIMELIEFLPGKISVFAQPEQRQTLRRRSLEPSLIQDNTNKPKPETLAVLSSDDFSRLIGATT